MLIKCYRKISRYVYGKNAMKEWGIVQKGVRLNEERDIEVVWSCVEGEGDAPKKFCSGGVKESKINDGRVE